MTRSNPKLAGEWVVQFCHGYDGPFLDCARQYAALFAGTDYKVCTVYLTGKPSAEVEQGSASDEVVFLNYSSRQVRGLKLKAIADFKRLIGSRHFVLCIAHRAKPIYIALLASKLPVIGVHHAFGDYTRLGRRVFANLFAKRLSLLGVSNAVRDDIRARLPRWAPARIQTLYNRVDIAALQAEQVSRTEAREHLGLPADAWVVANVGRLHPDKDQATLLDAFAQAKARLPVDSVLVILGQGRLDSTLKAQAQRLGISDAVLFLGQVPQARRYFKAFDAFALSSDHEPFGMVLLEAMVAGVPVIASNCGGAPEVIKGAGLLFPLGDASRLAEGLEHLAGLDDELLHECAQRMQARLQESFSDAAVSQAFWQLPQLMRFKG